MRASSAITKTATDLKTSALDILEHELSPCKLTRPYHHFCRSLWPQFLGGAATNSFFRVCRGQRCCCVCRYIYLRAQLQLVSLICPQRTCLLIFIAAAEGTVGLLQPLIIACPAPLASLCCSALFQSLSQCATQPACCWHWQPPYWCCCSVRSQQKRMQDATSSASTTSGQCTAAAAEQS